MQKVLLFVGMSLLSVCGAMNSVRKALFMVINLSSKIVSLQFSQAFMLTSQMKAIAIWVVPLALQRLYPALFAREYLSGLHKLKLYCQ